jgi:hypothetical protein
MDRDQERAGRREGTREDPTSARVERKIYAAEKASAMRKSLGYRGSRRSLRPVHVSVKPVR